MIGVKGLKLELFEVNDILVMRFFWVSFGFKYGGKVGFIFKNFVVKVKIKKD